MGEGAPSFPSVRLKAWGSRGQALTFKAKLLAGVDGGRARLPRRKDHADTHLDCGLDGLVGRQDGR
jgi:hypothetical protein